MNIFIFKLIIVFLLITIITLIIRFRKYIQKRIDHAISKSVFNQLSLLAIVSVLSFGFLLLMIWLIHGSLKLNILDSLFALINPGSSFSSLSDNADKIWVIIIGILGMVLLGGLLISVFNNILERRVDKIKNGQIYYRFERHFVIIGYDKMTTGIVKQLSERYPYSHILIQTIQEVPKVYHELFSHISTSIEKKVTIISGNRNSTEDLEKLCVNNCREIFLLGENKEYDHDSLNIECLKRIRFILENKKAMHSKRCNYKTPNDVTDTI